MQSSSLRSPPLPSTSEGKSGSGSGPTPWQDRPPLWPLCWPKSGLPLPEWVGCCTSCPEDPTSCAKSPRSFQTVAGIFVLLFGSLSPHPHMDSPWADLLQRGRSQRLGEGKEETHSQINKQNSCEPKRMASAWPFSP